jgi:hypothetical protein
MSFMSIAKLLVVKTQALSLRFNPNGRLAVRQPRTSRTEVPDRRRWRNGLELDELVRYRKE